MKKQIRFLVILGLAICITLGGVLFNNPSENANSQNVSAIDILCEEYTSTITPNGFERLSMA